ncbi:MAG: hypothetical protein WBE58_08575, partial [Verrucomicrobiales bacterium]
MLRRTSSTLPREATTLTEGQVNYKRNFHIARTYDDQGRLTGTRLQCAGNASAPAMDHAITYTWTEHHQLASVKSLAGEFRYQYAENNPALLTQMTSPVHRVDTTYEPKRDLIAEVRNVGLVGNPQSRRGAEPNPEVEKKSVASVASVV